MHFSYTHFIFAFLRIYNLQDMSIRIRNPKNLQNQGGIYCQDQPVIPHNLQTSQPNYK